VGATKTIPFNGVDDILKADFRFAGLYAVCDGQARPMDLSDHHAAIARASSA
jgi:hypothetical protein